MLRAAANGAVIASTITMIRSRIRRRNPFSDGNDMNITLCEALKKHQIVVHEIPVYKTLTGMS
jgi:hypothetical protein